MADKARLWTDKKLSKMEKKIEKIYKKSYEELREKWAEYMDNSALKLEQLQKEYDAILKSGDQALIKAAKKKLIEAKKNQTLKNQYYNDMVDDITLRLANVNEMAIAYVNDEIPKIYKVNYNQIKADAKKIKVKFSVMNDWAIKHLITTKQLDLPKKKVEIPKDKAWNKKIINSAVLQGIIQGEPMKKIADRVFPEITKKSKMENVPDDQLKGVVKRNKQAAIRTARTMVTSAENKGRTDSYKALEQKGVILVRIWIATADGRTRNWHLSMDGQERAVDEKFVDGNGNELEYPGDPKAPPETTYNCRCGLRTRIIGVQNKDGSINAVSYNEKGEPTFHEKQIQKEREKRK